MLKDDATASGCENEANYLQVDHGYLQLIKSLSTCVDKQECDKSDYSIRLIATNEVKTIQSNDINDEALHECNGNSKCLSACIDYLNLIEDLSANEHDKEMGNSREYGALYDGIFQNTDTYYKIMEQTSGSTSEKISQPSAQHSGRLSKAHQQQVDSNVYIIEDTLNTNFDELVQNTICDERLQSTHLSSTSSTLTQQSQFMTAMSPSSFDSVNEGTTTHFLSLSRSV